MQGGAPTQSRGLTTLDPKQMPHPPLPSPKWVSGLPPCTPVPTPKAVLIATGASPTKALFEQNTREEIRKEAKKKKQKQQFFLDKAFLANEKRAKIDKTRLLKKKCARQKSPPARCCTCARVGGRAKRREARPDRPKRGPGPQAGVAPRSAGRGWHKARQKNPATQGHRESEGGPGPTRRAL